MALSRCLAVALATLGLLFVGSTAQAGTQLYTGELIFNAFGNQTSTGTVTPFLKNTFAGIPFGTKNCAIQPFHAQSTLMFTNSMVTPPTITLTIPNYGGAVGVYDTTVTKGAPLAPCTTMWTYPGGTNGMGLGATGCMDMIPDQAVGCLPASQQAGSPLTGSGTAATIGGGPSTPFTAFTIPASDLARASSGGQFAPYGPYIWSVLYGDLKNQGGSFGFQYGPGNFTVTTLGAKMSGTQGPNKFGGTMQLLGTYYGNEGYEFAGHISAASYTWLFQDAGGTAPDLSLGDAGTHTATNSIITTAMGATDMSMVQVFFVPWTTGTVTVSAMDGPNDTRHTRMGFDNRTSMGVGTIQLVTPQLQSWVWQQGAYETAAIGMLKITVPEPREWMMLGAGFSLLGLLYYGANRRSR